jgi:hypothetical protein
MRKKRILFATNYSANDTTSFLRAWGPFTLMRDEVEIIEPIIPKEGENIKYGWWSNWRNWFNNIDVCFMHRPFGMLAAHIMSQCQMHGIPLWVDHDDDLLAIPDQNPHAKVHQDAEKQFPSIEMSYKHADILTCSGQAMHKQLREKYGRGDAILITTGLDDRLLRLKQPFGKNRKISWRGSQSHKSDLRFYERPIKNMVAKNATRDFFFWGIDPEELWPEFKNYPNWKFEVQLNLLDFLNSMAKVNAQIHFVPLEDNHFNRVKSNLSWLDSTLAGSACVAPNYLEFQRPGVIQYNAGENQVENFEKTLNTVMDLDPEILKQKHDESWEYIQENLMQSKLNQKRREILRNL